MAGMVKMCVCVSVQLNLEQNIYVFFLPKIRKWLGTCSLSGSHMNQIACIYARIEREICIQSASMRPSGVMYDIDIVKWHMWSYQHSIAIPLSISICTS